MQQGQFVKTAGWVYQYINQFASTHAKVWNNSILAFERKTIFRAYILLIADTRLQKPADPCVRGTSATRKIERNTFLKQNDDDDCRYLE